MADAQDTEPATRRPIIPWPSITSFPQHYVNCVEQYTKALDGAATLIQRFWRSKRPGGAVFHPNCSAWRLWRYRDLHEHLAEAPTHAHEKFDGTNVSHTCEGDVFGRRQRVEGTSYQKVPLSDVHAAPVRELRAAIEGGDAQLADHLVRISVFGELMCNGKYGYRDAGLVATWPTFGVMLEMDSAEAAAYAAEVLPTRGFLVTFDGRGAFVKMVMCPALRELFAGHNMRHPPHFHTGPLLDLIEHGEEFMMNHRGEGVVVTIEPVMRHHRTASLFKWKIGAEAQGSNPELLLRTLARLTDAAFAPMVHPRWVTATEIMLRVARHEGEKVIKPPKPPKAAKTRLFPDQELEAAIESALTKYDDLDTFFARGKEGRQEIVRLLHAEVCDDVVTPEHPPEAQNEVGAFINRYVGVRYGRFTAAMS